MRKLRLSVGLLLLFGLLAVPALGQRPQDWLPFQPVEGLNLRLVRAIGAGQDSLWIGTADGLYRYDGHSAELVLSGGIAAVLTDQEGGSWFAGGSGLYRLAPGQGEPEPVFRDVAATALYQARDGSLWAGTPAAARRLDPRTLELQEEVVVRPEAGIDLVVKAIAEDSAGRLWLGTQLAGVFSCVGPDCEPEFGAAQTGAVYTLLLDSQGVLWLGSDAGAFRYQGGVWEPVVDDRPVQAIFEDGAHELWLGTSEGLIHYRDGITFTTADGLPDDSVHAIAEDRQEGGLWVGTGEGVARLDGRFWRTFTPAEGLPRPFVGAIASDGKGGLWVGTTGGVCHFEAERCLLEEELAELDVQSLWWDAEGGELWIVAWEGRQTALARYDGRLHRPEPPGESILALARDQDGRLWAGALTGLFLYDGTLQPVTPQGIWPEQVQVNSIHADGQGYIWLGTDQGLLRCSASDRPDCDGQYLAARSVLGIADDGEGSLWLATDAGVYLYVRGVNATSPAAVFAAADGLPADTVNAIYRDDQNVLWFGTRGGLSRYLPGRQPPRLVFDRSDERLTEAGTGVTRDYDELGVPFRLEGSDFRTAPGRLLYSFVLQRDGLPVEQGVTGDPALTLTQLGYNHLRGERLYQLRARALDRDLRISDELVLPIIVKPRPLTRESWFPAAAAITFGTSLVTGVGVREARRRRGRFAYRYDVELRALQAGPDSLTYGVVTLERRRGRLRRLGETPPEMYQLQLDKLLGQTLPMPTHKLEELVGGDMRALGQALYRSLVPGELHEEIAALAAAPKYGLRLRLCFDQAPGLATLPWELMHGGEGLGFIGQREDTALVRYASRGKRFKRQWVRKQARVLAVFALPEEAEQLGLSEERARLDEILSKVGRIHVDYLLGVRAAALLGENAAARDLYEQLGERLREKEGWDVVHFVGHARLDRQPEPGKEAEVVLWFEDKDGGYLAVDAARLGTTLSGLPSETKPKLVVLNACETAHVESKLVLTILDSGVGAVVGMQWPVLDDVARAFTEGFYGTLQAHGQVDRAVSVARNSMAQVDPELLDWTAPVLVMQTADGFIFKRA